MHDRKDSLALILEVFSFLESEHGFARQSQVSQPNLALVSYVRETIGVSISEEMYDGVLLVYFSTLLPSGAPDWKRQVTLTDLVIQRHPVDYEHAIDYRRAVSRVTDLDVESLRRAYLDLAALLREYGTDLLHGDWSIEPAVRAWHRAKGGP